MKIIIHGGFFSESATNAEIKIAKQTSLKKIVSKAYQYLKSNSAIDTAIYATSLLEDDLLYNAGTGSQIQSDGKIRLSASLMDGQTQKFAGLINIQNIQNPIILCKMLLEMEDRVLSGDEALNFARTQNIPYYNPEIAQRKTEYEAKLSKSKGLGTVGCVVLDTNGNLAAATSTGGKGFEIPGRVSDSATVAGNYANHFAAVSCTGVGEDIVSASLASKIVTRVSDGFSLEEASNKSFSELKQFNGFAGIIGITAKGEIYHCDSHSYMVWASCDEEKVSCFA
jgi:L-asparaginase